MNKEQILKLFPIGTERLILRVATFDDAHFIQTAKENRSAEVLRRWMSWSSDEGMSMQGTTGYLSMVTHADNQTNIALLAVDKETSAHVLSTGLDAEDADFKIVSTGWWLSAGHEGKGLAYEAMRALLDVLTANAACTTILADHYEGNERSGNLMRRLGFEHIETKSKAHKSHLDGLLYDVYSYRLDLS